MLIQNYYKFKKFILELKLNSDVQSNLKDIFASIEAVFFFFGRNELVEAMNELRKLRRLINEQSLLTTLAEVFNIHQNNNEPAKMFFENFIKLFQNDVEAMLKSTTALLMKENKLAQLPCCVNISELEACAFSRSAAMVQAIPAVQVIYPQQELTEITEEPNPDNPEITIKFIDIANAYFTKILLAMLKKLPSTAMFNKVVRLSYIGAPHDKIKFSMRSVQEYYYFAKFLDETASFDTVRSKGRQDGESYSFEYPVDSFTTLLKKCGVIFDLTKFLNACEQRTLEKFELMKKKISEIQVVDCFTFNSDLQRNVSEKLRTIYGQSSQIEFQTEEKWLTVRVDTGSYRIGIPLKVSTSLHIKIIEPLASGQVIVRYMVEGKANLFAMLSAIEIKKYLVHQPTNVIPQIESVEDNFLRCNCANIQFALSSLLSQGIPFKDFRPLNEGAKEVDCPLIIAKGKLTEFGYHEKYRDGEGPGISITVRFDQPYGTYSFRYLAKDCFNLMLLQHDMQADFAMIQLSVIRALVRPAANFHANLISIDQADVVSYRGQLSDYWDARILTFNIAKFMAYLNTYESQRSLEIVPHGVVIKLDMTRPDVTKRPILQLAKDKSKERKILPSISQGDASRLPNSVTVQRLPFEINTNSNEADCRPTTISLEQLSHPYFKALFAVFDISVPNYNMAHFIQSININQSLITINLHELIDDCLTNILLILPRQTNLFNNVCKISHGYNNNIYLEFKSFLEMQRFLDELIRLQLDQDIEPFKSHQFPFILSMPIGNFSWLLKNCGIKFNYQNFLQECKRIVFEKYEAARKRISELQSHNCFELNVEYHQKVVEKLRPLIAKKCVDNITTVSKWLEIVLVADNTHFRIPVKISTHLVIPGETYPFSADRPAKYINGKAQVDQICTTRINYDFINKLPTFVSNNESHANSNCYLLNNLGSIEHALLTLLKQGLQFKDFSGINNDAKADCPNIIIKGELVEFSYTRLTDKNLGVLNVSIEFDHPIGRQSFKYFSNECSDLSQFQRDIDVDFAMVQLRCIHLLSNLSASYHKNQISIPNSLGPDFTAPLTDFWDHEKSSFHVQKFLTFKTAKESHGLPRESLFNAKIDATKLPATVTVVPITLEQLLPFFNFKHVAGIKLEA